MVKINKTLGLALLTALAASCSSDNDVTQAPEPVNNNGSAAYATLRIDLPTQQGSRAVTFYDGLPDEYMVHDATLLVFKKAGSSEGEYTFVESVDLKDMTPWTAKGTDGITTTADVTAKLSTATLADLKAGNCYGLVILNNTALTESEKEEEESEEVTKITLPTSGTTYSAWNDPKSVTSCSNMSDPSYGIVMANAPKWTTPGQVPTTLVQINGGNVKATEALAKAAGPAAEIHVERGLAKVTMEKPADVTPVTGSAYSSDKVTFNAWALDVTNKKSYPVHNIVGLDLATNYTDIWKYTEGSSAPTYNRFQDHTNTFKRVYWGIDPNYSTDLTTLDDCKADFDIVDEPTWASTGDDTPFEDDDPQYCLENTFDIDHMKQGQTTRVLIKATYKKGGSEAKTFYKFGSSSKLYTAKELEDALAERYLELNPDVDEENLTVTLNAKDNDITKAGVHDHLTTANFVVNTPTSAKPRTRNSSPGDPTTITHVVPTEKITTYENGVCYYIGRIKHFGDDETPWSVGDPTYGESNEENNKKYLGRYGVLRNNWYSLSVNSVSGPGDPTVPPVNPEEPDDDNYNYIDLGVKILQWAKRTQGLDL